MSDGIRSGGELHPPGVEPQHGAERLDQLGLGQAGEADEQAVAAGQDGDEGEIDDFFLAEDDPVDCLARLVDRGQTGLVGGDDPSSRLVVLAEPAPCAMRSNLRMPGGAQCRTPG